MCWKFYIWRKLVEIFSGFFEEIETKIRQRKSSKGFHSSFEFHLSPFQTLIGTDQKKAYLYLCALFITATEGNPELKTAKTTKNCRTVQNCNKKFLKCFWLPPPLPACILNDKNKAGYTNRHNSRGLGRNGNLEGRGGGGSCIHDSTSRV